MKTTASLFIGGGGFEIGAMMAGYTPIWGIEIRPDIAAVAECNIPGLKVIVSDVAAVDYSTLESPDHLHASPSCKNASNANSERKEAPEDLSSAMAVCRAIQALKSKVFTLENVWAYRNFESFKLIVAALRLEGYFVDWWHLNAANYGVPQTRKRLILIARLDRQPRKPVPTHSQNPDPFGLYKPWVGWLEAIQDLVDSLPEDEFAPWQMERLPEELKESYLAPVNGESSSGFYSNEPVQTIAANHSAGKYRAFLMRAENTKQAGRREGRYSDEPAATVGANPAYPRAFVIPGDNASNGTVRESNEPMVTIQSRSTGQCPHRAFIVDCQKNGSLESNGGQRGLTIRNSDEPVFTITANQNKRTVRSKLPGGRVVRMTPRCLARFQSFPDSYILPEPNEFLVWVGLEPSNWLACEVVGNAVPPLLARAICEAL